MSLEMDWSGSYGDVVNAGRCPERLRSFGGAGMRVPPVGAALGVHDIAYLVGVSVDAVRNSIASHKGVILPTRGQVADMGPTLSHAERILGLYMDGYTETKIVRRTGHSYDSVERLPGAPGASG